MVEPESLALYRIICEGFINMTPETRAKIGLIGGVVRGPPPATCATTCLDRNTDICGTCSNRPIKSVDISFGEELDIETAIRKGLTTAAEVEAFRKQITGGF